MLAPPDGFTFSDDKGRLDLDWVWRMMSAEVYWARWRTRDQVLSQIESAWRVVGAYDEATGAQVAFCRAISDGVDFAYLADVVVDPGHRGRGVGKGLIRWMIDDGPGAAFRWTLFTADAHGLYEQFGFMAPGEKAMERPSRNRAQSRLLAPTDGSNVASGPTDGSRVAPGPAERSRAASGPAERLRVASGPAPSLDGRRFRSGTDVSGGDVGPATVFAYCENDGIIHARYSGGAIGLGFLVGTRDGDELDFRYAQVRTDGTTAAGQCHSEIRQLPGGRLRLHETWRWESAEGSGFSVLEEVERGPSAP